MKPMTKSTWRYTNPGSLAASGAYSDKDFENLRDHIMFPFEKSGILNTWHEEPKANSLPRNIS